MASQQTQNVLDQLGGPVGLVYSALPIVAFVAANAALGLTPAVIIAIVVALAVTGIRLLRKESLQPAFSGVLGVLVAGGVAAWTGSANGFFLVGIWSNLLLAIVTVATLLARRPLTGLAWNAMHGGGHPWREDDKVLRAHYLATGALAVIFTARFIVQEWLYLNDSTGWLATAKLTMGTPLLGVALLVVFWAFRRTSKELPVA